MANENLLLKAWAELEPVLREQGYELVEVEFGQHGARHIFRVFIDSEKGVTVDDCAAASRVLDPLLDTWDCIPGAYFLEVSSPGIDRPLRKAADFVRFTGEEVKIKTRAAVGGRQNFKGALAGFSDGLISLHTEDGDYEIHIENVLKARLER